MVVVEPHWIDFIRCGVVGSICAFFVLLLVVYQGCCTTRGPEQQRQVSTPDSPEAWVSVVLEDGLYQTQWKRPKPHFMTKVVLFMLLCAAISSATDEQAAHNLGMDHGNRVAALDDATLSTGFQLEADRNTQLRIVVPTKSKGLLADIQPTMCAKWKEKGRCRDDDFVKKQCRRICQDLDLSKEKKLAKGGDGLGDKLKALTNELANVGKSRSTEASQETCKNKDTLGWQRQRKDGSMEPWQANAWSCNKPVGFNGIEPRTEQYQVNSPGCPERCERREGRMEDRCSGGKGAPSKAATTSESLLEASTDVGAPAKKAKITAMVDAAAQYTGVLSEAGTLTCFGNDMNGRVSECNKMKDVVFQSVSLSDGNGCGVEYGTMKCICWGRANVYDQGWTEYKNTKFSSISVANRHICGAEYETMKVFCWGSDEDGRGKTGAEKYNNTKFSSISVGHKHTCGVEYGTMKLICWGNDAEGQAKTGAEKYKNMKFSSISVGKFHNCGLEYGTMKLVCWGRAKQMLRKTEAEKYKNTKFSSISAAETHTCGVEYGTMKLICWGGDKHGEGKTGAEKYKNTKFSSFSAGKQHNCGLEDGTLNILCWGQCSSSECTPPLPLKVQTEPSCATEHPEIEGPIACTSCPAQMPYHTIIDPKRNSGTCTKIECPFCKPGACCGPRHKHYIVNTESLEGVCVKHTDDCTPVCVPVGDQHPEKRRVCSKGCNLLVKVSKDTITMGGGDSAHEKDKFSLVVCQADKRIVCEGRKSAGSRAGHKEDGEGVGNSADSQCMQNKTVAPVAVCNFAVPLWNLGGTCISNHVHKEEFPHCPNKTRSSAVESIVTECRKPTEYNGKLCTKDPGHKTCKQVEQERDYCTRLAMSY